MTFLVVGLGNFHLPSTRHNMGMMAIDWISKAWKIPFVNHGKLQAMAALAQAEENSLNPKAIFLKPKGFMNLSGIPVSNAMKYYKVPVSKLVIIHDDLERKLGKVSLKNGGSANGHNGLKSIIHCLGRSDFVRIRVGIDRPGDRSQVSDYVLSNFSNQEHQVIDEDVMPKVEEMVRKLLLN